MNLRTGQTSGAAVRIADSVSVRSNWTVDYAVSRNGTVVYDQGHQEKLWTGKPGGRRSPRSHCAGRCTALTIPILTRWPVPRRGGSLSGVHQVFVLDLERGTALRHTFEGDTEFFDWGPERHAHRSPRRRGPAWSSRRWTGSGTERILWTDGGDIGRVSVNRRWIAFGHIAANRPTHGIGHPRLHRIQHSSPLSRHPLRGNRAHHLTGRPLGSAYVSDETGRPGVRGCLSGRLGRPVRRIDRRRR